MPEDSTKKWIWDRMHDIRYCTLANQAGDDTIDMRMMAFSCTEDLKSFYMLSPRSAKKVKEFINNRRATLLAYTLTDDLEDFVQFAVKGTIGIHLEVHTPDLKKNLLTLAGKLGFPPESLTDGNPGDSVFLELRTKEIQITEYKDILHRMPESRIKL